MGTLPLAPLANVERNELPAVLRRLRERLVQEAAPAQAERLEVVTYTLLGLRYPPELAQQLMPEITRMRESSTYQAILEEGRAEGRAAGLRGLVLELGSQRFGPPDPSIRAQLEAIGDASRLDRLGQRLLGAASWDELLSTP